MFPRGNGLVNVPACLRENKEIVQSSLWYTLGAVIICVNMKQEVDPKGSACFFYLTLIFWDAAAVVPPVNSPIKDDITTVLS